MALVSVPKAGVLNHEATLEVGRHRRGRERQWSFLGDDSPWPLPRPLPQTQTPGARACQSLEGTKPPFRALTVSPPSCSAPCKAFSLNSLPFSRTPAAHICGNQGTATPPTRPARLPRHGHHVPSVSFSSKSGTFQPPSTPPASSGTLPVEGDRAEILPFRPACP